MSTFESYPVQTEPQIPKLHIGRRWGAGVLFLAGLDEGISPNGAVWAAGRTVVIESYKRVSPASLVTPSS
jgi:hypothetical protein